MSVRGISPARSRRFVLAAVLVGMLSLTGCSTGLSDDGKPLTVEQADTLAQVRFRLAAQGDGVVRVSTGASDAVDHVSAELTVDFDDGIAWGDLKRGPDGIAVTEHVAFSARTYLVEGVAGWQESSPPSPMLTVLFALGADRPENAQLLRQSDARYLGSAVDEGQDLEVFRAPSADGERAGGARASTRLWVDDRRALRRMDAGDDVALVIRPSDVEPAARIPEVDRMLGASDE